jgi:hypothetical protein
MRHHVRRLVVVVAFETGTLAWLAHLGTSDWLRIDWSDLDTWLQMTPTDEVLAATVWLIAIICAGWLTVSTLLYVAARLSRIPAALRSVQWMTLPAIRRLSEGALAALLVTASTIAAPAEAQAPPVVVVVDDDGKLLPPGLTLPDVDPIPPLVQLPHEQSTQPAESRSQSTDLPQELVLPDLGKAIEQQDAGPVQITVEPGDNLWTISRSHLMALTGEWPGNHQIAPYWRRVIELNRPILKSGNPDLIYPGEVVTMPNKA